MVHHSLVTTPDGPATGVLVELGELGVDWAVYGTAWLEDLHRRMSQGSRHSRWGPAGVDLFEVGVDGQRFVLHRTDRGDRCFLVLPADDCDDVVVQAWVNAVDDTTRHVTRLGEQRFRWSAVIGPSPGRGTSRVGLSDVATVGDLTLSPGSNEMWERFPRVHDDIMGWSVGYSWPIVVEGVGSGVGHDKTYDAINVDLRRLCAVVSLAWDDVWSVRLPPQINEVPWRVPQPDLMEQPTGDPVTCERRSLPSWCGEVWRRCAAMPHAEAAMNLHYESHQLVRRHPSFACMGFVATIETVGQGPLRDADGRKRGSRPKNKEAFRSGLAAVVDAADLERLTTLLYEGRSRFAHNSHLLGYERRLGTPYLDFFADDDALSTFDDLRRLRDLSRRAVLNEFGVAGMRHEH